MSVSWNRYFMGIAEWSSQRSKDPRTKVGACIVNDENHIVGTGYNGLPAGMKDRDFSWEYSDDPLQDKGLIVCHAEMNAVLNSTCHVKNCTMYCTLFPCAECAKIIVQTGINKLIYKSSRQGDTFKAAAFIMDEGGVNYIKYGFE